MKSRALKVTVITIAAILGALVLVTIVGLSLLQVRTASLHDDWQSARQDAKLSAPVQVEGVDVITQDVSCGYAVIEMFSAWDGGDITEETSTTSTARWSPRPASPSATR